MYSKQYVHVYYGKINILTNFMEVSEIITVHLIILKTVKNIYLILIDLYQFQIVFFTSVICMNFIDFLV